MASPSDPTQDLADRLRADLTRGEYHPRERLIEGDLVDRYEAPRATVRSALVQLQAEGLVERTPNRGASVRALSLTEGIELAEIRRELEALCARDAALRATSEDRDRLRITLEAMAASADAGELRAYQQTSITLHELVIDSSRHTGASRQLAAIRNHNLQRHFPAPFQHGPFSASLEDHFAIGEAILDGDSKGAAETMRRHVDRVVSILRDFRASS